MKETVLAEQIAAQLRRDILRGKLPPGSSVKERDNAAELGVSRTPMREAIRILATEGLLRLRPSRSPIVAQMDYKEVTDQAHVLVALEKLSAELACVHATKADTDAIAAILGRMAREFDTMDPLDMFEIDMAFHAAIAQASHNDALAEAHRSFQQRLWRARYLSAMQKRNRDRVISQHSQIVDALRARDPEAAVAAIHAHLKHLAADIAAVIEAETEDSLTAETEDREPG